MKLDKVIAKGYHSFAFCCKCLCHVAHIVVIRRRGATDDLSQCTDIMVVETGQRKF